MKNILLIIAILFSLNVFAEPQKLEFQYRFNNPKAFEKRFPFLVDTNLFKDFKEYELFAKENNWLNELYVSKFNFNKNVYYLMIGTGGVFCGSSGCYFEIFSVKDNKVIVEDHIPPGTIYLDGNVLYFQYSDKSPKYKYDLSQSDVVKYKYNDSFFDLDELSRSLDCTQLKFDFSPNKFLNEKKIIIDTEIGSNTAKEILEKTKIGVAFYDLNDDGNDELIAKMCNIIFFGSNECAIYIYEINGDLYKNVDIYANFNLCVSSRKTNGYYDLYSIVKITDLNIDYDYFYKFVDFKYSDGKYFR